MLRHPYLAVGAMCIQLLSCEMPFLSLIFICAPSCLMLSLGLERFRLSPLPEAYHTPRQSRFHTACIFRIRFYVSFHVFLAPHPTLLHYLSHKTSKPLVHHYRFVRSHCTDVSFHSPFPFPRCALRCYISCIIPPSLVLGGLTSCSCLGMGESLYLYTYQWLQ